MNAMLRILVVTCLTFGHVAFTQELSDEQIRQLLIDQSIRSYSGSCPCPYSRMKNGRRCGGNAAYSKPGGARPLCYASDVSDQMVERYKSRRRPTGG